MYLKILQINEKDRTAQDWLLLGNVMADSMKMEDAVYMYKKAIQKDKKCYRAYYNLGNYYFDHGKYEEAMENYTKAYKLQPENPYICYNIGCTALKQNDLIKAKLQEKEEGKWNVIIGKDFSTFLVHRSRRYGLFKVGELNVLVWQSGSAQS